MPPRRNFNYLTIAPLLLQCSLWAFDQPLHGISVSIPGNEPPQMDVFLTFSFYFNDILIKVPAAAVTAASVHTKVRLPPQCL